ncbi:MAG: L,D-transpeptidase [Desulfomonile sp.]
MFLSMLKVLGVGLILFFFANETMLADDSPQGRRGKAGNSAQKATPQNLKGKGIKAPEDQSRKVARAGGQVFTRMSKPKTDTLPGDQPTDLSYGRTRQPMADILHKGSLPGAMSELLQRSMPLPAVSSQNVKGTFPLGMRFTSKASFPDARDMDDAATRTETGNASRLSSDQDSGYLEIEVSHSGHTFKLCAGLPQGGKQTLYECRVGLGGPGFPTPVGTYYVTHIYDDDPWWIPPKDRAWAAGNKPSRRVYGGTMAPLLKKRDVKSKKDPMDTEDKVSGQVKMEDYGYRFHGTNAPRSIGHNQSHGCVRMLPQDAKKVATLIKEQIGTADRKGSENGSFVVLKSPVRLNLVK